MTATLVPPPRFRAFSANGAPLAGGKLYSYQAGTSTPKATFTDQSGATPNANPVVLDANGEAHVWLDSSASAYKLVLQDASSVQQWSVDNISDTQSALLASQASLAASGGSALLGFLQAGTGAVTRTVQAKLREAGSYSVRDFGAAGDGVTNDTTAFANAVTAAGVGGQIEVPPGVYVVNGLTLLNRQSLIGLGGAGGGAAVGVVLKRSTGTPTGITTADGNQRLHVANLDLQGYTIGLDCRGVNYSYFENLHFADSGRALYLGADVSNGCIGNTFVHLRATGSTVTDIDTDVTVNPNNCNNNRFFGGTFESTGVKVFRGIGGPDGAALGLYGVEFINGGARFSSVTGVDISGCYFEGGICVDLDNACNGVSIRGNYFRNFNLAAIRLGNNGGATNGSGAGIDIGGNAFWNDQNNGIGVHVLSANLTDVHIGANFHSTGGVTYTRVSDANHKAAAPMETTAKLIGQGSAGVVKVFANGAERLEISGTRITPQVNIDCKTPAKFVLFPVVVTASLPSADASNDGKILIEDAGAGARNLIIFDGAQRFRIAGGVPF